MWVFGKYFPNRWEKKQIKSRFYKVLSGETILDNKVDISLNSGNLKQRQHFFYDLFVALLSNCVL